MLVSTAQQRNSGYVNRQQFGEIGLTECISLLKPKNYLTKFTELPKNFLKNTNNIFLHYRLYIC